MKRSLGLAVLLCVFTLTSLAHAEEIVPEADTQAVEAGEFEALQEEAEGAVDEATDTAGDTFEDLEAEGFDYADLVEGEKLRIPKVCDMTPLNYTIDAYAYGSSEAGIGDGTGKGAALRSSSPDYQLLDLRVYLVNRKMEDMVVEDTIQARLFYEGKYTLDKHEIYMEVPGTSKLSKSEPIPMLVDRTLHIIFQVPNVVASEEGERLEAIFTIDGEEHVWVIRE